MITREKAIEKIAKQRLSLQFQIKQLQELDDILHQLQHDLGLPADDRMYPGELAEDWVSEPIAEDAMAEDYNRAVDELQGLYPQVDDHDRRFDDMYSNRTELPDNEDVPPY